MVLALILVSIAVLFVCIRYGRRWASHSVSGVEDGPGADMLGREGVAEETFSLSGTVFVRGELWKATTERGIVHKGDRVRIVGVRPGLLLVVEGAKDHEESRC